MTWGMTLVSLLLTVVDFDIAQQWQQLVSRAAAARRSSTTTKTTTAAAADDDDVMPEQIRPKHSKFWYTLTQQQQQLPSLLPLLYFANPVIILRTAVYLNAANVPLWLLLRAINLLYSLPEKKEEEEEDDNDDQSRRRGQLWGWLPTCLLLALVITFDPPFAVFAVALTGTWEYTALLYTAIQVVGYVVTGTVQAQFGINSNNNPFLSPPPVSLSVLWYTHIQFFTRFAPYLKIVLGALPYIVILPCAIRLHKYPIVLVRGVLCFGCIRESTRKDGNVFGCPFAALMLYALLFSLF